VEFWNLVFMQYERGEGPGKSGYPILGELPRRNIDTGRCLVAVYLPFQGVETGVALAKSSRTSRRSAVWPSLTAASHRH
jgi:hypothetical protein